MASYDTGKQTHKDIDIDTHTHTLSHANLCSLSIHTQTAG